MDFVSAIAIAKAIRFLGLCLLRSTYIKSAGNLREADALLAKTEQEAQAQ